MASSSPLSPTFFGHIASTQDALLLFEACLGGALNHVARRPHDRERTALIKSGNVFIYEEHSSGIKRWTDGVPWSPSRILGNFLVYRELERPFPPGEKKRAMKRSKRSAGISKPEIIGGTSSYNTPAVAAAFDSSNSSSLSKETERSLIGSLVDSYGFKEEGLVKKTVSVTVGGISHHLVSYYSVADVMNNKFTTPSKDPRFQHISPRPDLVTKQNFRTPIDEVDTMDRMDDRQAYPNFPYARNAYEMTTQSMSHRSISLLTPPMTYHPTTSNVYPNYGVGPQPNQYEGLGHSHSSPPYGSQFGPPSNLYPAPKTENYDLSGYRQQRYNPTDVMSHPETRSQGPQGNTNFARRPPTCEQSTSIDSGLSGMSAASNESKLTNDSGYSSQEYYSGIRDPAHTPQTYTPQRSLPTPTQPMYDRPQVQQYPGAETTPVKTENMWSMGNQSAGHAHYAAPPQPQQWASTGSS